MTPVLGLFARAPSSCRGFVIDFTGGDTLTVFGQTLAQFTANSANELPI